MTEMQTKLLEMLKWLTEYLEGNGIRYYAVGGTLLGAIRHKGFIPWDDDVDIAIPRPDYDRLINIFGNRIGKYVLETPYQNNNDFLYTFSKLYDTSTTLIEKQKKNVKRGIYIDIFPLDGLGTDYEKAIKAFKKVDQKNMFLMTRTCAIRKQRKWYKNVAIILSRIIPFINNKKLSLKIDSLASAILYDDSTYIANLNGAYREREIVKKELFEMPTKYQFETINIYGPSHYDEYLTQIYHDWKSLPPIEKRGIQHDYLLIDLKKSYLDGE
ncbi:MAG: LicD family protein [Tenericutes bacterium ADurb.BinA124]|nr:MAG: LicD family protein [Tenericutes bacterium ADurb.BinA124]